MPWGTEVKSSKVSLEADHQREPCAPLLRMAEVSERTPKRRGTSKDRTWSCPTLLPTFEAVALDDRFLIKHALPKVRCQFRSQGSGRIWDNLTRIPKDGCIHMAQPFGEHLMARGYRDHGPWIFMVAAFKSSDLSFQTVSDKSFKTVESTNLS